MNFKTHIRLATIFFVGVVITTTPIFRDFTQSTRGSINKSAGSMAEVKTISSNNIPDAKATAKSRVLPSHPYIGKWSNGRGEPLVLTETTIQYGHDPRLRYRDITGVTNGREFHLDITEPGKLNYFTRFLTVSLGEGRKPDEMKITLFDSRKDMEDGANSQGENSWYRDK